MAVLDSIRRFWFVFLLASLFAIGFAVGGDSARPAQAVSKTLPASSSYPSDGLAALSADGGWGGRVWVGTNGCGDWREDRLNSAAERIRNDTRDSSQIGDRYEYGISHIIHCATGEELPGPGRYNVRQDDGCCADASPLAGNFNDSEQWEFFAWWDDNESSFCQNRNCTRSIGGRNRSHEASSAYCTLWGFPSGFDNGQSRCGNRDVLQLNTNRGHGTETWIDTIVHEFIHPHGFADCDPGMSIPSATANGGCRGLLDGQNDWTVSDRSAIRKKYDNSFASASSCASDDKVWLYDWDTQEWETLTGPGRYNMITLGFNQRADQMFVSGGCTAKVCDLAFDENTSWGCAEFAGEEPWANYILTEFNIEDDVSSVEVY